MPWLRKGRGEETQDWACPPYCFNVSSHISSVQFSSVAQSCLTLCDPVNRSTLGLPVHHHLPEFTQTHVHQIGDAIQPSHPLSSPFPPAPNPSQHYSAIKKNTFESVLMRWMKLEPFIQSEVSRKENHQYSILKHIYGIQKDGKMITL